MKIFISWSGDLSNKVALVLQNWLPSVIQSLEPYVSSENIDKGARWSTDISNELEDSAFGILCVTKDNINAPWLIFEAGALSKSVDKSRVAPFLFGVKNSDLQGPILQFQSTNFDEEDVRKLIQTINEADDPKKLDEIRINQIFDVWWPKLNDSLNEIETTNSTKKNKVDDASKEQEASSDILEELLDLLRSQHRLLNSPEELFPSSYLKAALSDQRPFPDEGSKIYIELAEAFTQLKNFANSEDVDDEVMRDYLQQCVRRLGLPIDFILQRNIRSSRHGRRLARPA